VFRAHGANRCPCRAVPRRTRAAPAVRHVCRHTGPKREGKQRRRAALSPATVVLSLSTDVNRLEARITYLGIDIVSLKPHVLCVKAAIMSLASRNKSETSAILWLTCGALSLGSETMGVSTEAFSPKARIISLASDDMRVVPEALPFVIATHASSCRLLRRRRTVLRRRRFLLRRRRGRVGRRSSGLRRRKRVIRRWRALFRPRTTPLRRRSEGLRRRRPLFRRRSRLVRRGVPLGGRCRQELRRRRPITSGRTAIVMVLR
jgi:hypothetical protein